MKPKTLGEKYSYTFIMPALLMLFLFVAVPTIIAFFLSFTDYSILGKPRFVGIQNYRFALHDNVFRKALFNTAYYAILYVPIKVILSFLIALALTQSFINYKKTFMIFFYLPVLTSMTASSMIWLWIYQPDMGILNGILSALHLPRSQWIYGKSTVIPSISTITIWKDFGYDVVIFVAGLSGIPKELYDAAKVDGAHGWSMVKNITLPLLKTTSLFVIVTSIIASFQVFTAIYIMTQGGPENASTTVVHQIYLNAFSYLKMGRASAMSFVLFVIILFFSLIQFKIIRVEE
ncbi:MAG: sugar ABC transporter permease [Thermotoga sp.]|nr:MAG: sugar ABC transporter permease [Thermotoga sp.]